MRQYDVEKIIVKMIHEFFQYVSPNTGGVGLLYEQLLMKHPV